MGSFTGLLLICPVGRYLRALNSRSCQARLLSGFGHERGKAVKAPPVLGGAIGSQLFLGFHRSPSVERFSLGVKLK
jgi:hypothetical protein